ncbi:hypothetical protein PHMEG_00039270 [Phytophthora megakarya]|uniref:HIT domain-containing protein n=1 Tax=Phytophthora megakarya TaxID=4795 RepID=A0A225UH63_9STRA|nr:hypothetical protein PHMEG_00039270 [Phytophthora megakarya]
MTPEMAANVFKEIPRLTKAVQEATGADGVNVVLNNGAAAGQMVFHAHAHVIPRFDGDGLIQHPRDPSLPAAKMITKEEGAVMQTKIQNKL